MAKEDHRSTRALAAAERLFKRKPDASTEEFRRVCERADEEAIGKLSNREFFGRYVLPLKRWGVRGKVAQEGRAVSARGAAPKKKATRKHGEIGKQRAKSTGRGGKIRRKRGALRPLSAEQKVIRLVRERDAALLEAAGDASKVYDIASHIDEFAAEIVDVTAD